MASSPDNLQVARAALAAIDQAVGASNASDPAQASVDLGRIFGVQQALTRAVAALTDELTALRVASIASSVPVEGEAARNSARVDPDMPAGGRGYDRGRPDAAISPANDARTGAWDCGTGPSMLAWP